MNLKIFDALLKGGRARLKLVLFVAFILLAILVGIYRYRSTSTTTQAQSKLAGVSSDIRSVPGSKANSPEYLKLLEQSNREAAQRALATGQSNIPTLINTSGDAAGSAITTAAPGTTCQAFCDQFNRCGQCGGTATTAAVLDGMVKSGDLSPVVASDLKKLAESGVSPSAYADKLNGFVKDGRLTSEQAEKLLDAYKKEHQALTADKLADQLGQSGAISADTLQQLKALDAKHLTPAEYQAALDKLVKEGKLTPAQAKALMAAYLRKYKPISPNDLTDQMVASGTLSPDVASQIRKLNSSGLSPAEYKQALDQLVKDGKLTPEQAKALLQAYQQKHQALSHSALTSQGVATGQLPSAIADQLKTLAAKGTSPADYQKQLAQLVNTGKLTPAQASGLLAAYNREHGTPSADDLANQMAASGAISPATAAALKKLNAEHLSPADYQKRLAQLVKEGKLTPAQARTLLAAYKKKMGALSPNDLVGQLVSSGAISPATAALLEKVNSENLTPEEYQKRLAQLVAEGKLTPAQARALLAAYKRNLARHAAANTAISTGADSLPTADDTALVASPDVLAQQMAQQTAAIQNQAQQLVTAWNPQAQTVVGKAVQDTALRQSASQAGAPSTSSSAAASEKDANAKQTAQKNSDNPAGPLIKAGTIMFAVLDTAVNSDQPGPIMATIVQGRFKGAKLMGSLQKSTDGERVMLSFNTMIKDSWPENITMNAVAINPDTAHTAIASDVDHHYLLKWGSLFASNFLVGLSSAITTSGSTSTNSSGTTTSSHPEFSAGKQALVGLGEVGKAFAKVAGKWQDLPTTVKVDAGVGMGILFTGDVSRPSFDVDE